MNFQPPVQSAVHRAPVSNLQQPLPLRVRKFTTQGNFPGQNLNLRGFILTILAIDSVIPIVADFHCDVFKG